MLNIELEKERCSQDFIYFVETYCKLDNQNKGIALNKLSDLQKQYFKDFQNKKFNFFIKNRQVGATTLLCAYAIWKSIFEKNQFIIFVSMNMRATKHTTKLVEIIIKNLPEFFKIQSTISKNIYFEHQRSSILMNYSTLNLSVDQQIHNTLANFIIFDEALYFYKDFLKVFYSYNSIQNNTQTIIISTENDQDSKMKFSRIFLSALFYMLNTKGETN